MLKNNKGFTLVELIVTISLLAVLFIIAIPNILNIIDNGKKEQYVADAKELISLAKYKFSIEEYQSNFVFESRGQCYFAKGNDLGFDKTDSPYGDKYVLGVYNIAICNGEYKVRLCSSTNGENTFISGQLYKAIAKSSVNDYWDACDGNILSANLSNFFVEETNLNKDKVVEFSE